MAKGPLGEVHTYTQVRGYATANTEQYTPCVVGQAAEFTGSWPYYQFWLWRGGLFFDTSGLGAISIALASLILNRSAVGLIDPATQWLVIVPGDVLDESGLVVADYGQLLSITTDLGHITGTDWKTYGNDVDVSIPLNSTGIAQINKSGWTKFALRGRHDILGVADVPLERNKFGFK